MVQRFLCLKCQKTFSTATTHPCFQQKKRHFNFRILKELCSGVSQRRIARNLRLNRKTIARKLIFLGLQAQSKLNEMNQALPPAEIVEFDDLETFEHSKCKPLSVTLCVRKSRWILGFEVSKMPAKGKLAKLSFKKYGPRRDMRNLGRRTLFSRIRPFIHPNATIKSDQNPHYPAIIKQFFPEAMHEAFKGQRGSIVGQGELKKLRFDPLFSLNHTCAMLRANINRLIRRTWCTTKIPEKLALHIAIYAVYHNIHLPNTS